MRYVEPPTKRRPRDRDPIEPEKPKLNSKGVTIALLFIVTIALLAILVCGIFNILQI